MLNKNLFGAVLLGALLGLGMSQALAQGAYPNRPVRIVVPLTTGGSNDILARVIADRLTPVLGQPVVYRDNASFRADFKRNQIPMGSAYDMAPGTVKYGYPISQVEVCEPLPVTAQGRVWRRLAAQASPALNAWMAGSTVVDAVQDTGRSIYDGVQAFFSKIFK